MFIRFIAVLWTICTNIVPNGGEPIDWVLHQYPKTDVLCFLVDFRHFCPSVASSSIPTSTQRSCTQGQTHSFQSMKQLEVTPNDLLRWIIPYPIVEQYAGYLADPLLSDNGHLTICNCTSNRIGMHCEYEVNPKHRTPKATLIAQFGINPIRDEELPSSFIDEIQCQIGNQALQWRQICNGIVDCEDAVDEVNCDLLEFHRCDADEFQCRHGLCIPQDFVFDGMFDCSDSSDEQDIAENSNLYEGCPSRSDPICDDRFCQKGEFSCGDGQCIKWTALFNQETRCKNLRHVAYRCDASDDQYVRLHLSRGICNQTASSPSLSHTTDELNCRVGLRLLLLCDSYDKLQSIADTVLNKLKQCSDLIEYPEGPVISPILHMFYNRSKLMDLVEERQYDARYFPPQPHVACLNGSMVCHGGQRMSLRNAYCMTYDKFLNLTSYPFLPIHGIFCEKVFEQHPNTINRLEDRPQNLTRSFYTCPKTFDVLALRRLNDGYFDCLYRNDEKNGDYPVSEPYRYRCQTVSPVSQYVSFQQLGNGIKECDDGSDEIAVDLNWLLLQCSSFYHYACWMFKGDDTLENRIRDVAIPFDRYCDTLWDTMDGRDERNCTEWMCSKNMRQCNRTGQCIDAKYIRDGEFDCDDGEDELNRPVPSSSWDLEKNCNVSTEHFCITSNYLNNRTEYRPCIPFTKAGDGSIDCIGGRDERNTFSCPDHTMLGNRFICDNQTKCVNYSVICNGVYDCLDLTDETICYWDRGICGPFTFACEDVRADCRKARCTSDDRCRYRSDRFWCPRLPIEPSYRSTKVPKSSIYGILCSNSSRPNPKELLLTPKNELRSTSQSFGYCNRGFYLTMDNGKSRLCFCPPSFYGDRCQYESRRVTVRYRFDRRHRADIPLMINLLISLVYNGSTIIDHKDFLDDGTDFMSKRSFYLLYPRPRPHGFYSVRFEAYDSTNFLAAWKYSVSPFDFLPVFHLVKILRFPDRPLPWFCSYNHCQNGGTCYVMNNNQLLCLCRRGWRGQFCENVIDQPIECAQRALVRDHGTCVCPYDYMHPLCFVRNTGCANNTVCTRNQQGECYPISAQPSNRFRCICSVDNCDEQPPMIFMNRQLPNTSPFLLQFLDFSVSDYPAVRYQILVPSLVEFPIGRIIRLAGFRRKNYPMPQLGLLFTFQAQLRAVIRTAHLLLLNCSKTALNYTVDLDRDPLHCSLLNGVKENSVQKFHRFCQNSTVASCFYSRRYLCFCNYLSPNRSECIPYVQQSIGCHHCLNQGYCVQGDLQNKSDFACVCPRCASGQLCQFSPSRFSISLELLIEKTDRIYSHFVGAGIFLLLGFVSNSFCFMTFLRPKSRQTGTGIYLLINGIISQLLLMLLLIRVIYLYLSRRLVIAPMFDLALCRTLPLLMSVSNYISLWLMTSVTVERAVAGIFPTRFSRFRSPRSALIVKIALVALTSASLYPHMNQYKLVSYPGNLYPWCINEINADRAFLIRITSLFHQIIPFVTNLFAGMTIIVTISRSKAILHRKAKRTTLAQQVRQRMDLLIGPIVCFITQLPQLIILFLDACIYDQTPWFLSLTVFTYYLSFVPQISLFLLYVVSSPLFKEVFVTQTHVGRRIATMISDH